MAAGHSTDSGWAHSSPSPAAAGHQDLARQKPKNNHWSSFPPRRIDIRAIATDRRGLPGPAALPKAVRKTLPAVGRSAQLDLGPGGERFVSCAPRIVPGEKNADRGTRT